MYIYVWVTKTIILKQKCHLGDSCLSNGTHTVTMYQHFCGECRVHLGIHIVMVVLYKFVISIGDHFRGIPGRTKASLCLYLHITILFNICITLKRKYTYFLTDLVERTGSMGIFDYRLYFRYQFVLMNKFLSKSKYHLAWPFLLSNWFYLPWIWRKLCYMFDNMGLFWVSIRSETSWEGNHHSTKNKLRPFHFRNVLH